eukprot:TRINITY_DN5427_c0_g1_i2.p2 TRINITY_DN5427_c0_g1~~TRINITY_DN5427_c0_g1_i2.p2  ORF type:complete len:289 (-),score=14.22 TRINITY_DN5427_c0_g1_i2:1896-2762(-)
MHPVHPILVDLHTNRNKVAPVSSFASHLGHSSTVLHDLVVQSGRVSIYAAELACDKGLVCQQIKNNAQCADPLLCTVGNMICKSRTTYSTCVTYTGIPSFGPEQSCPEGLVCQPSGNFVHCVSAWPSSSLCTVGTMICTSETTYATCSNHLGLPSYFPEQSCPFGLVCSPVGNEIYCVHSTATLTLTQTPAVSNIPTPSNRFITDIPVFGETSSDSDIFGIDTPAFGETSTPTPTLTSVGSDIPTLDDIALSKTSTYSNMFIPNTPVFSETSTSSDISPTDTPEFSEI